MSEPGDPQLPPAEEAAPFALAPPEAVRKRDGALVPFDPERIREAVRRAQAAVGEPDPPLPEEVTSLVLLTLASRAGCTPPPPPGIEELQDLVEEALIGLGRSAIAKAYILYRDRRQRARSALSVHDGRPAPVGERGPVVRGDDGNATWNPARITAALVAEAGLPREIAEEVATRVEARVLSAGLPRVSTALIREFVDNEVAAMGLSGQLHRQQPVTLARVDLRDGLAQPRGARAADDVPAVNAGEGVADRLLRRWSLEDVLPPEVTELHLDGTLHLEDVGRPHQPLVRCLPVELLSPAGGPRSKPDTLERLADLLPATGQAVVLEGVHGVLPPSLRPNRAAEVLSDLLSTLGVMGRTAGRHLDLAAPGGRGGGLVARLLPELARLEAEGRPLPRLFLSWEDVQAALEFDETVADPLEALLARGRVVPVWHGRSERWAGPGCRRRSREKGALACGAAAAINLPRLARRAGPWREDLFFEELSRAVRVALDGLEALGDLQAEAARGRDTWRERVQHALVPVGLTETLRILGDGTARVAQGARVLGVFSEVTRRFSAERGGAVVLSPILGEGARRRMAELDARGPRPSQARLFDDLPAPESELALRYGSGFPLTEVGLEPGADALHPHDRGEAWATLLSTVASGALFPLAGPDALPAPGTRPHLETWRSFHLARERSRAGVVNPAPANRRLPLSDDAALFRAAPERPASTGSTDADPTTLYPQMGSPETGFPTTDLPGSEF